MNGAQMVVKALELEGVRCVFGIPGGSVIPLYDALYDAPFPHILVRHEQAAAHAADGYARVTGEPGVCICTSGPGFTNILTGLATAFLDSVPMVAITGQVSTSLIGTDAFQEADTFGASLPAVKHSILVRSVEEIPSAIRGAFELAVSGRPGPVLIDLPVDIQRAEGEFVRTEGPLYPEHHLKTVQDVSRLGEAVGAGQPVGGLTWARRAVPLELQVGAVHDVADAHQAGERRERVGVEAAVLEREVDRVQQVRRRRGPVRDELASHVVAVDEARGDRIDGVAPAVRREVDPRDLQHARPVVTLVERLGRLEPVGGQVLVALQVPVDELATEQGEGVQAHQADERPGDRDPPAGSDAPDPGDRSPEEHGQAERHERQAAALRAALTVD